MVAGCKGDIFHSGISGKLNYSCSIKFPGVEPLIFLEIREINISLILGSINDMKYGTLIFGFRKITIFKFFNLPLNLFPIIIKLAFSENESG